MQLRNGRGYFNLMLLPGMTETMAQNIYQSGFASFQIISEADTPDIMAIPGYEDEDKANGLIDSAIELIKEVRRSWQKRFRQLQNRKLQQRQNMLAVKLKRKNVARTIGPIECR